jgi:hypothetical protein
MSDQGIAWMIAGGARHDSPEDRRMQMHRIAIAQSASSRGDTWLPLRQRVAGVFARRAGERKPVALTTDCCTA